MLFLVAMASNSPAVTVPAISAAASSSKYLSIAAGEKRTSFLPGRAETTLNVCGVFRGHVHEGAGRAVLLTILDVHQVLILQDVERLDRVTVTMHWWPEVRRLSPWTCNSELSGCLGICGEDERLEVTEI
jgi:hypothetical protein